MNATETEGHYSQLEIQSELERISDADYTKVLQTYRILGCEPRSGLTEQEVLGHVVYQALALERKWPKNVTARVFLRNTGRSIISNEADKRSKLISIASFDEPDVDSIDDADVSNKLASPMAEQPIECQEKKALLSEWVSKVFHIFEEDVDATCYLNQKLASAKKSVILSFCEFTDQVYRNVEKRIKDKVRKRFPDGFPWWEIES